MSSRFAGRLLEAQDSSLKLFYPVVHWAILVSIALKRRYNITMCVFLDCLFQDTSVETTRERITYKNGQRSY